MKAIKTAHGSIKNGTATVWSRNWMGKTTSFGSIAVTDGVISYRVLAPVVENGFTVGYEDVSKDFEGAEQLDSYLASFENDYLEIEIA